ncbi:hypothetical protein PVK06_027805 [Gossypium arboreum]|uniref:Uncharacterized protein n=1 Tax=Gossypium arboreum TaxID=29729 RepID=A0ABR0P184_GOSAR|nr:hypothetical protein PVK06_027805 [Gossypium arboreum]
MYKYPDTYINKTRVKYYSTIGAINEAVRNGELIEFVNQSEIWNVEFSSEDEDSVCNKERNDPMVVLATVAGFEVKRIHVDSGNAVEVLSWEAYRKIGLKEQL